MSGPVDLAEGGAAVEPPVVEVLEPREATVGTMTVQRALPRRQRRTVGAWCFVDLFGPASVTEQGGVDIGPHPHIGLHTVTYLLDGQVLHRDSLGSEQVIRPGQVNLMTAGRGVVHAEEPTGHYRGTMQGVQLWVAQPDGTRGGEADFAHLAELPQTTVDGVEVTVLVGSFGGATSPARQDTPLVGAELRVPAGEAELPLDPAYEHALVVLQGSVLVEGRPVERTRTAYLGVGRTAVGIASPDGARVLLLGGEPFGEELLMWWNFVGRTRDEVTAASREWAEGADRFGKVATALARVPAPPVPWR
ncbi:MAG: quercetin 2,3-dioxygenase [Actinomycetota bacterium]|jgi:redox-sensitive bicupin YhaK (pirin superfamily)|nr:quercetin 2,3-dioxygenase [Actinomycetota bacterium]